MKNTVARQIAPGGFGAIASTFVIDSLEHMIPWLIVTCAVVMCDLFFGLRKSLLMDVEVRFSRAMRATMGKMVTYFAFVVMVCMINVAAGNEYPIEKYSCLFVCFIEGCSIISNILKPKGIKLDFKGAMGVFFSKILKVDKSDLNDIIKEDKAKE